MENLAATGSNFKPCYAIHQTKANKYVHVMSKNTVDMVYILNFFKNNYPCDVFYGLCFTGKKSIEYLQFITELYGKLVTYSLENSV